MTDKTIKMNSNDATMRVKNIRTNEKKTINADGKIRRTIGWSTTVKR